MLGAPDAITAVGSLTESGVDASSTLVLRHGTEQSTLLASILTRGARFFVLAALLGRFGPLIKGVLDRHLNAVAAVLGLTIVGGFAVFRYLF